MTQTVAFLRAINVGGRNVKMDTLRDIFRELGLKHVATYVQSGNVIFDTPDEEPAALAERMEAALTETLGYEVPVMLRSMAELAAILEETPFEEEVLRDGYTAYVSFLREAPDVAAVEKLLEVSGEVDELQVHGRDIHWLYRRYLGESRLTNAKMERLLDVAATRRNRTTVLRLLGKYGLEE